MTKQINKTVIACVMLFGTRAATTTIYMLQLIIQLRLRANYNDAILIFCYDALFRFGIGGDGQIYEGRGFDVVGAHAPRFNDKSIGICMIGDWSSK